MKKYYDKIFIILLMGSLWGAFELFGGEILSAMAVPHKSPFFFSFAIMTMIAAKRLLDFPGSSIVIAIIVIFYKSFSSNFHVCAVTQISAIMVDGVAFELGYQVFKRRFEASWAWRSFGGLIIAYAAYTILMSYNAIFDPEGFAACGAIPGAFQYIKVSGTSAAVLSIFSINAGFLLGEKLRVVLKGGKSNLLPGIIKVLGLMVITGAWVARFIY